MRAADDAGLREDIAERVEGFMALTAGGAGGMHARIAEAFAIVSVSGRMARRFGILPREWDPEAIALESYRRYVASVQLAEGRPAVELLRSYAARPDLIDLDQGVPDLTDEQLRITPGFRRTDGEQEELCIHPNVITRLFADWEHRKDSTDVRPFLSRDGSHYTRKRVVRQKTGKRSSKDRVHVFTNF